MNNHLDLHVMDTFLQNRNIVWHAPQEYGSAKNGLESTDGDVQRDKAWWCGFISEGTEKIKGCKESLGTWGLAKQKPGSEQWHEW